MNKTLFDTTDTSLAASLLARLDPKYAPAFVGQLPLLMQQLLRVYEHLAGNRPLDFRGGSWRLPHDVAQVALFAPLLQLCELTGITTKGCKENLIATP